MGGWAVLGCWVPWLLTGSPQLGDTRHMTRLYTHPYITASHSTHVTPCVPTSPSSIYPHTSIRHLDTNISHPCMLRFRKLLFVIWAEENSWNKCLHLHKLEGSKMQNKHEINVTFISGRTHLPHAVTVGITDTIKNTMLSRQTSKGFEESILNQPTHPFMNFASVFQFHVYLPWVFSIA